MPNDPTIRDQSNPQYGPELLLVTVGSVLLVVALAAIAATSSAAPDTSATIHCSNLG
jgi:hypothetical protein